MQQTGEYNRKEADSQIEQTSGYQWGERGGAKWGGEGWYKLLGVRQAQGCTIQHKEYSQ